MSVDNPGAEHLGYPQGCGAWGFVVVCLGNAKDSRQEQVEGDGLQVVENYNL